MGTPPATLTDDLKGTTRKHLVLRSRPLVLLKMLLPTDPQCAHTFILSRGTLVWAGRLGEQ
jgi:hypothetical protein